MTIMTAVIHLNEASNAAMATVWVPSLGVGVSFRSSSNSWWWKTANSAPCKSIQQNNKNAFGLKASVYFYETPVHHLFTL